MSATFRLKRTAQCPRCPWKVNTDPFDIPDGYDPAKHANLSCTIAESPNFKNHAMACHHSEPGNEEYCIGWLENQFGAGNNIALRLKMRHCENIGEIQTYGEQHQRFEDTLPD